MIWDAGCHNNKGTEVDKQKQNTSDVHVKFK